MNTKNVIEIPMVPYRLSDATVTDKGQYMLFTSIATNDSPGIASFDSRDFNVANGKVSIGTNYPFRGEKKRLLASDANGVNTIDLEYDRSAKGDAIVQRDAAGHVLVPKKTNNESAAISFAQAKELSAHDLTSVRDELATKLDKTTDKNVVYGTDFYGRQMKIPVSTRVNPDAIVVRDTVTGDILVPYTPEYLQSATSKDYVDRLHTALGKRVRSLEGAILTHVEDTSPSFIQWTKVSPVGIGTPAFLKYIEGRTERVQSSASKNILNPKELTSQLDEWISGVGEEYFSYVLNEDGSITYRTDLGATGFPDRRLYINIEQFPEGTYFLYTNLTDDGYHSFEFNGVYAEIDISPEWDAENEVYVPITRTLKVMLYFGESADYWDVIDATYDPQGPVAYEPYAEPTYSLVHQKPMQILSYSANLFGGSALLDVFVTNYPDDVTVDYANETITLKEGNYTIPVPEIVRRQDGPSIRFIVKGQGNFRWSADGAELEINSDILPETQISTWSEGYPMHMIDINVYSDSTIYYEKCGTFISSYDGDGISDVSDFQPYLEEPVGELFLPEFADFDLGVGITGYCNSFAWNEKFFIATEKAREIVLNGSEKWIKKDGNSAGADYFYFATAIPMVAKTCVCDAYDRQDLSVANKLIGINIATVEGKSNCIIVRPENADNMTVDDFKAQLAEKPITLVYALQKPNTIVEEVENVSNEIDTCPYSVFRFFGVDGTEMSNVINTIAYVVRRGGVNNVDG